MQENIEQNSQNIGLIAGNGRFPFLAAQGIKNAGKRVVCVALKEEADPSLAQVCDEIYFISIGKFQKILDAFKNSGVKEVIMAGQVKHVTIYAAITMDWRAIKVMASLINKKTDTMLETFGRELEKEQMRLISSTAFLKEFMAKKGLIAGKPLSQTEQADAEFGFKTAKAVAGLDIGQTVVVKDTSVLAVESVEGTDECIRRAAKLGGKGIVVCKVAKPNQDFRFDVPVIGPRTIETLKENKARAMIIEADSTLILDADETAQKAKQANVTIIAL
ncbi:MAG: UDP-2,3-diacylglucosamine diphosphatase LpxI [Elusimicrobiota bacterium]|jgi:DUF1009 family protein|nr:UDP-2,3-diacylglucosamine diphosphatase LpxI [Elusimicrobiota bacterium]